MSDIFKTKFETWKEVESSIANLPTNKAMGNAFEKFLKYYFNYPDHIKLYNIKKVYMTYDDIPSYIIEKFNLSKRDEGVDGVLALNNGEFAALQAMSYAEETVQVNLVN